MVTVSRHSPAVLYPLRRSGALGWAVAAVLLVGAAGLFGWALQGAAGAISAVAAWAALGVWVLAAVSALHFWWHQASGWLRWDGQSWTLEPDSPHVTALALSSAPEVLVDLQSRLWVSVHLSHCGHAWLWLDRSIQPERWMDLRRAVYSRARPGADNADETAPASASRHGRES
jgi:hypothetical protein